MTGSLEGDKHTPLSIPSTEQGSADIGITQGEVRAQVVQNSQNIQEMPSEMRNYLEGKGYKIVSFEVKEGVEFQGERLSAVRVQIEKEGQIKEGVLMTRPTTFKNQVFEKYSVNTKYRKIYDVMRSEERGPNKEFFNTTKTTEEYIWIGDQQKCNTGEVITGKVGYGQTKEVGQNSKTALLEHIQYKIITETIFGETTYTLYGLRGQVLKNGKFSINNITDKDAKKDIGILKNLEEKLGVQIFARNRSGEIVDLYQDWIIYEANGKYRSSEDDENTNRLLALSGFGYGTGVDYVHGLFLSGNRDYAYGDVSARVAL